MDPDRFDALSRSLTAAGSRRRAVTVALGGSLGLLGLAHADEAAAKKKCPSCKKAKNGKCKKNKPDGTACPGGTCQRGRCVAAANPVSPPTDPCPGKTLCNGECIPSNQCCTQADCPPIVSYRCCNGVCTDAKRDMGNICTQDNQCCSDYCQYIGQSTFSCAATCRGKGCAPNGVCCRGYPCLTVSSNGNMHCGGCGDFAAFCETDADCCFSACTKMPGDNASKQCVSYAGQRCAKNADCRSCSANATNECVVSINGTMQSICTNGVCGCPDGECCSNDDCPLGKLCERDEYGLNGVCKTPEPN